MTCSSNDFYRAPGKSGIFWLGILAAAAMMQPAGEATAGGLPGYWVCVEGAWEAHGRPEHPEPLASCNTTARPVIRSEEECEARGGSWRAIGIFPQKICVMPTIDGGRFCADAGECEGTCVAELTADERERVLRGQSVPSAGTCTRAIPSVGCMAIVEKGFVNGILCLD